MAETKRGMFRALLFGGAVFAAGTAHAQTLEMVFYDLDLDAVGTDGYASVGAPSGSASFTPYSVVALGAEAYAWGSTTLLGLGADSDEGASAEASGGIEFAPSASMTVRVRWDFRGGEGSGGLTFIRKTPYLTLFSIDPSGPAGEVGFRDVQLIGGLRYQIVAVARSLAATSDRSLVTVAPFSGPVCPADLDGNGTLNFDDIDLFVTGFLGGNLIADLDGNGTLNFDDIDAFVEGFLGGCP